MVQINEEVQRKKKKQSESEAERERGILIYTACGSATEQ